MKWMIILICLAVAPHAWAEISSIQIKTELLVNGQTVGKPQVQALVGEPAEVQVFSDNQGLRMKFLAKPVDGKFDEIFLDMDVAYNSGGRDIQARPTMVAKARSETIMDLGGSDARDKVQLKVTATPVVQ